MHYLESTVTLREVIIYSLLIKIYQTQDIFNVEGYDDNDNGGDEDLYETESFLRSWQFLS
jgi:hypothetical protein